VTRSLKTRLLTGIIAATILLLAVFSATVYIVIRSVLLNQFDASLASVTRILAASVELDGEEIELEFEVQQMPEFQNAEHATYYELWGPDGSVAARSPLLGTADLARLEGAVDALVFAKSQTADNRPLRTAGLKFKPRASDSNEERQTSNEEHSTSNDEHDRNLTADRTLTLVVARDASGLLGQLRFLRWLLLSASAAVIALSLLIAAVVVRRGLAPLNAIAGEIAAISGENLATRIDAESAPSEIVPIKDRLNDLLSRLEDAFSRERRFTADVAHELRTPLAGLRATIEVTLARARDSTEHETVLSDCLAITDNMQTMVANLLMLARLDAHQVALRREPIRPAELADSAWRAYRDSANNRHINSENSIPEQITCQSDGEHVSMVLQNILANAVEYADDNGQIRITARRDGGSIEIAVSNTGCRLSAEQTSQVFDSFWRADASRSDAGVHCGLGLALVKKIAIALGGTVTAEIDQPDIFTIRLTIPCRETPATD